MVKKKNIHIIEKNIYITNDEKIKEEDWCYNSINNNVYKKEIDKLSFAYEYKIILTTDGDLIKDGVQAIDDDFLEWFVKNPSCEWVEVNDWLDDNGNIAFGGNTRYQLCNHLYNKEIIPKEEQKQHLIDIMRGDEELGLYEEPKQIKCYCGHTTYCDCGPLKEPKQETLEEAAENYVNSTRLRNYKVLFIEGAKWQQERMYSEKDLKEAFKGGNKTSWIKENTFEKWFEQFKKVQDGKSKNK